MRNTYAILLFLGYLLFLGLPITRLALRLIGAYLRRTTRSRRHLILSRIETEERAYVRRENRPFLEDDDWEKVDSYAASIKKTGTHSPEEWEGIIGFFHPFCNAGGGGERVLWAAIRATQKRYPRAVCIVYTGDHDATKADILEQVKNRFDIELHSPTVIFLYLSTRRYVLASTYPRFTLLGQSLGSLILAGDAFSLLVPDVFVDTMGYAFSIALFKYCFPKSPAGAYVHYPTISTDMLSSLDSEAGNGLNAGTGKGWKGYAKKLYWRLFARIYGWVGGHIDVVMTNSSWTQSHIRSLWGPSRRKYPKMSEIEVVFPPVAVEELESAIDVSEASEQKREKILICIAQFRPEKNHAIILRAFAKLLHPEFGPKKSKLTGTKLALIGSVRDSDDSTRVYDLRLLAHELKIKDDVEFVLNASWPDILKWLGRSSVGVNGMWNEHFGIGVVEYQAAGLISVVNNSGGPKEDIIIETDGGPTGFHASNVSEYTEAFTKALSLSPQEMLAMRCRARISARRFTEEEFASRWLAQIKKLIDLQTQARTRSIMLEFDNLMILATCILPVAFKAYSLYGT